jgi:hypothetical protein
MEEQKKVSDFPVVTSWRFDKTEEPQTGAHDHQRCEGRPAQFYIPCERLRAPWAQPLGDHGSDSGRGPQRSEKLNRRLDSGRLPPKYAGMSLPRAYLSQKLTEPLPTKGGLSCARLAMQPTTGWPSRLIGPSTAIAGAMPRGSSSTRPTLLP